MQKWHRQNTANGVVHLYKKGLEELIKICYRLVICIALGHNIINNCHTHSALSATELGKISNKVQESRLKWYGLVLRREEEYVGKRVVTMKMPGKKERKTEAEVVG